MAHQSGSTFSGTVSGDTITQIGNMYISNSAAAITGSDRACLQALFVTSPQDDMRRIQDSKDDFLEGTCSWITQDSAYLKFFEDNHPQILWVHGNPGKGKTMFAISQVLHHSKKIQPNYSVGMDIWYFFCDSNDERRNTAKSIIRGLLHQCLSQYPNAIHHLRNEYERQERFFESPTAHQALWRIFENVLDELKDYPVYFILDALDECDSASLKILLNHIKLRIDKISANEKWLLTSRDYPYIRESLRNVIGISLEKNFRSVSDDVQRFINAKVRELEAEKKYNADLTLYVTRTLREKADGTFLWVSLACAELRQIGLIDVKATLNRLPGGLTALYDSILQKILQGPHQREAKEILVSVLVAFRPLSLQEVVLTANLSPENCKDMQSIQEQVEQCGPLIVIRDYSLYFVHLSAGEFLRFSSRLGTSHDLEKEHSILLQRCFSYVSDGVFLVRYQKAVNKAHENIEGVTLLAPSPPGISQFFLKYPISFWPAHAKHSGLRAKAIFDKRHMFWQPMSELRSSWAKLHLLMHPKLPKLDLPILHLLSYFGLEVPIGMHINRWWKKHLVTAKDCYGHAPLYWAALEGHIEVVKLLIKKGADVNDKSDWHETALQAASAKRHEAIVQLLLSHGADANIQGRDDDTALRAASRGGHEAIVQLLLSHGADANIQGRDDDTALRAASAGGHEAIVQLLLDHGADVNMDSSGYGTALHEASARGYEAIVQLLLSHGANVNEESGSHGTALYAASRRGYETIVQLLPDHGADVNVGGGFDGTALQAAAREGHEAIVQLLLSHGADVNIEGREYGTALQAASSRQHKAIVQLLLDHGASF